VVGLYLIFQALDGAVVRRRGEIAILRSLGVEERAIRFLWLVESALLGLLGGVFGLLLGWAGAQVAVRAVGQTVNALYFATTVSSASLAPAEFGIGLGVGVAAAILAGLWPANEAARTPPAHVLQRSAAPAAGSRYVRSLGLAVATLVIGVIAAQLPGLRLDGGNRFPLAGYAAAFLWIVSAGLFCGFLLPPLAWAGKSLGRRSVVFRLPLSHLRRPSGRHRLAAAALVCAIGMTAGMAVLVASFEETMQGWVRRTLHADLYLASSGAQSASSHNRISASAAQRISTHPAVLRASPLLALPVDVRGLGTTLIGSDLGIRLNRPETTWIAAPLDETIYDPAKNEGLALVTESLSERFHVRIGDTLTVPTPTGPRELRIAGIYAEYGNERGSILVERAHLQRWFQTDALTNLAVFLKPGADADTVRADLLRQFPGLSIFTNAKLRSEILRIFRQTFSITYALEVIGVVVAVVGLALTLISVFLDRREELTTLRALGLNHQELARAGSVEGTAISVCAVLAGIALSLGLGWLLIYVINKQSFGWTLGFVIPWGQLLLLALAVIITGAVVSYWVGRWGAQLPADREE
jgi:putative ABC transport system permease protein